MRSFWHNRFFRPSRRRLQSLATGSELLESRSLLTASLQLAQFSSLSTNTQLLTVDPSDSTAAGGTGVAASSDGRYLLLYTTGQMIVGNDASLVILDTITGGLTPIPGSDSFVSPASVQMSADGRFVSFVASQVELYDRQTNTTEIISQTPNHSDSKGTFFKTLVSDDGRFVAFTGEADDLFHGFVDGNGQSGVDLFLRDRQTNETVLVNRKAGKTTTSSNAGSDSSIFMSSDGHKIFFNTFATDLAPNDSNGPQGSDIYVFDAEDSTVSLVSVTSTGAAAAIATSYTISDDGRYVAFDSFAANIVAGISLPSHSHAYVRDLQSGLTRLVDHAADGSVLESDATFPQITPDGQFVLFQDDGPFLTSPPITTTSSNVYVRDMTTNQIQLVSVIPDGSNAGNQRSSVELSNQLQISENGRYVTFVSRATNLVPGFVDGNDPLGYDLYLRDLQAGTTVLVSKNQQGTASGNQESSLIFASPIPFNDGRVLFSSPASDLSATPDSNAVYDAFLASTTIGEVPYLDVGSTAVVYTSKQPAVIVLPQITVGGANAAGGQLAISIDAVGTKKKEIDRVHFPPTSAIGTSTGPVYTIGKITLQIQLDDSATATAIQSFLRGITFLTKGKGVKKPDRTMIIRLTDASGGQSPMVLQSIQVQAKSRHR